MKLILANILPGSGRPVAGSLRVMGGRIEFKIDLGCKVFPAHVDGIEASLKKKNLVELAGQGEVRFVGEDTRVLEVGFAWPEDAKYFRRFAFSINGNSLQFEDDGSGGFVLTAEAQEFDCFEQSAVTEKSAGHGFVHATLFPDGSTITRATQTPSDPSKQDLADLALEKIVGDLRQQAKSKLPRKATPEEVAAFATDWIARHGGRKRGLTTAVQHEFGIKHNSTARARLKAAGIE